MRFNTSNIIMGRTKEEIQELISEIYYNTDLTAVEKQEQIRELQNELDMGLFEEI